MEKETKDVSANPSGAPEAGGATTMGSVFGGKTFVASVWRWLARMARDLEQVAYRRLRDMESQRKSVKHPGDDREPGAPRRVKGARKPHPA